MKIMKKIIKPLITNRAEILKYFKTERIFALLLQNDKKKKSEEKEQSIKRKCQKNISRIWNIIYYNESSD